MSKIISCGFAATMTLVLFGCAGVPQLDIPSQITVAHIVDRIQCEAYRSVLRHPKLKKEKWVGAADLFLQVDDNAGVTPTLSYIEPLATAGTQFAFGVSGTLRKARQRVYSESIKLDMAGLNAKACTTRDATYDLTGDLGIIETLDIAAKSIDENDVAAFADKEAVGQTLQFILTRNVSGGPTWTLAHFTGVGSTFAGAERVDTHKLIVSFTPGAVKTVTLPSGKKVLRPVSGTNGFIGAQQNNQKLLLQSLPTFQQLR